MADDAGAAVAFLRRDSVSRALRINPQRITLVGGSAGTLGALRATAADPTLRCVAAIVPFNWTLAGLAARRDSTMLRGYRATIANLTNRPQPPIRTDSDFVTAIVRDAESYDLRVVAGSLRDRNVYLVGAQNDETAPLMEHFYPLVQAARAAPAAMVRDTIVSDGHSLTSTFTAVFAATSRWLREFCSS
jgi:acetyl esterase/lipase